MKHDVDVLQHVSITYTFSLTLATKKFLGQEPMRAIRAGDKLNAAKLITIKQ